MFRLTVVFPFLGLVALCCFVENASVKSSGGAVLRQNRQVRTYAQYSGREESSLQPSQKSPVKKAQGSSLSGWGVVAIILSVIFMGFAMYYSYLLYPILCKQEGQYNTIELNNV